VGFNVALGSDSSMLRIDRLKPPSGKRFTADNMEFATSDRTSLFMINAYSRRKSPPNLKEIESVRRVRLSLRLDGAFLTFGEPIIKPEPLKTRCTD
jgi:hypothetical protein